MGTTTTVAVIGTLSTVVVAIAGYVFGAVNARGDRKAARELAQDAHEHDASVRRSDRLYDDRKEAYLDCVGFAITQLELVMHTEPFHTLGSMPPAPAVPTQDDWRLVQIKVHTFGSPVVDEALERFMEAVRDFHLEADLLRNAQRRETDDEIAHRKATEGKREAVGTTYQELLKRVNQDIMA